MRNPTPFYVFLGTKAQYIKTAPVMLELDRRGIDYGLIDSGQHAEISSSLRPLLGLREPDVRLGSDVDIVTIHQAALWFASAMTRAVWNRRWLKGTVFGNGPGLCIVHGDTPTTFMATAMARLAGCEVAHIEAGLRSFRLFKPFPEEMIRIVTMRMSQVLFAPSQEAVDNLKRMNLRGEIVGIGQNTNIDAIYHMIDQAPPNPGPERYALMTIHRVETLVSRWRLGRIVDWALRIADELPLIFILHGPTRKRLHQYGLMDSLSACRNITLLPLQAYPTFVKRLADAQFVVTDGGSIQEECHYVGVPCLLARSETERPEGLGDVVVLSRFDRQILESFLGDYPHLARGTRVPSGSPTTRIVDVLEARYGPNATPLVAVS